MSSDLLALNCPTPVSAYDRVVLAHGGGGRLSAQLFRDVFLSAFDNPILRRQEDQATLALPAGDVLVTTDAFVVRPLFFPGGDIGSLSVHGTLNDLAVGGATPHGLCAAFVLEEGLPMADLRRIVASMAAACRKDDVSIVAGDTKVVERGAADGVFITTTGIGVRSGPALSIAACRPGDRVVVSGMLGDHGIAVLSVRDGLSFGTELTSDSASVLRLTQVMRGVAPELRCMRDPTRGGLGSSLNEIAQASHVGIVVDEAAVPVRPAVRAACEMLGLDPLYVANEGKVVAIVPPESAEPLVAAMQKTALGADAAIIGEVVAVHPGVVAVRTGIGGGRVLPMLSGEQLPRIC